tara:strand:+ start:140022 stop:141125 length:1104 start_codon:yes stop_codon:yes gene_type:complete
MRILAKYFMKTLLTSLLTLLALLPLKAQLGGQGTYDFLNIPFTAQQAALGGDFISVRDDNIEGAFRNPASLTQKMSGFLTLSYINYIGDINFGNVGYVFANDTQKVFSLSMQYANYGKFNETTPGGEQIGSFNAADYILSFGYGKKMNKYWSAGANFKPVLSSYYNYLSVGLVFDLGAVYQNDSSGWSSGITLSNVGMQIKPYVKGNREPVQPNLTVGVSKKVAHTPIRLSLTAHNLQTFNLVAFDTTQTITQIDAFGQEVEVKQKLPFYKKIITHFIIGTEFIPSKNFAIRFGYNFLRRQEMKYANKTGLVGISLGTSFKISKFKFSYSLANYHLAGTTHYFTISTLVGNISKRGEKTYYNEREKN